MANVQSEEIVAKAREAFCRRRHGRLRQEALWTNLGPVLDLSASGMRIATRHPPLLKKVTVKLTGFSGRTIVVRCTVKWRKRIGFLKYVIGLRIDDADPMVIQQLTSLCRYHQFCRTL